MPLRHRQEKARIFCNLIGSRYLRKGFILVRVSGEWVCMNKLEPECKCSRSLDEDFEHLNHGELLKFGGLRRYRIKSSF